MKRISENDILSIHIEKSKVNKQGTVLLVIGIVIVSVKLVFIIGLATSKLNVAAGYN